MTGRRIDLLATFLAVMLLAIARGAAAAEEPAKLDPRAEKIVRQFADYYKGLKSFRMTTVTTMKVKSAAMNTEMTSSQSVTLQRPNKLAMVQKSGMMGGTVITDGAELASFIPTLNRYVVEKAPVNLADVFEGNPATVMASGAAPMLLKSFTEDDPYTSIMAGVSNLTYVGKEPIEGAVCHHLKFVQPMMDIELWVDSSETPFLRQATIDMSKAMQGMGGRTPPDSGAAPGQDAATNDAAKKMSEMMKDMKMDISVAFKNWAANIDLKDEEFKFTPPDGAVKVASFFEGLPGAPNGSTDPKHPLVGKPAPAFALDLLNGGKMDLAQHKNKDIVILDFWATWCGPCTVAMPKISGVADEYKKKGVVLYAVNLKEDADKVSKFLEQRKLGVTVALDKDGHVGELYKVESIPQTVIIGKDGSVQAVHVGLLPGLEEKLKGELDKLLSGEKLEKDEKP